jgi:hypothetical protein
MKKHTTAPCLARTIEEAVEKLLEQEDEHETCPDHGDDGEEVVHLIASFSSPVARDAAVERIHAELLHLIHRDGNFIDPCVFYYKA